MDAHSVSMTSSIVNNNILGGLFLAPAKQIPPFLSAKSLFPVQTKGVQSKHEKASLFALDPLNFNKVDPR